MLAFSRSFSNSSSTSAICLGTLNMPIDLVLVRHGAAEGNLAFEQSRKGNDSLFTDEFMARHESKWRLTDRGRDQARLTGEWIKQNVSTVFGCYLTSEYVRALETAALLDMPNATWRRNTFLRERNFGRLSSLSYHEREKRFSKALEVRKKDNFYWKPPSGESLADVALRVDYIIGSLQHMDLRHSSALIVTHFNVMQVFRTRIESIRQSLFEEKLIKIGEHLKIKNGGVIHYTRRNPNNKDDISHTYKWMRIATPYIPSLANPEWMEINYKYLTNEDILKELDEGTVQQNNK